MTPTYWLWSLSSVRQSWATPYLSRLSILTWASWKVLLELCLWVLSSRSYSMVSLFSVRTNRSFEHPRKLKSLAESYIYFSRYSKDSIWIKLTVSIIMFFKSTYILISFTGGNSLVCVYALLTTQIILRDMSVFWIQRHRLWVSNLLLN